MRIGFITCVRLGESCLEELINLGADLVYLGTLHDDLAKRKSGRIYLDDFAARHELRLQKFRNINDPDALQGIREAELDWLYVIGWSQIARREVLSTPSRGVIGMHPTLLPQGRGRASIPWAIIKGLDRTGVTLFQLDEGMDTGPILGQVEVPITPNETSTTLYEKVAEAHRVLIRQTYAGVADGTIEGTPQNEDVATEWPGRRPEDGLLLPETMTEQDVDRYVRALTHPYPGAFIRLNARQNLRIWCGKMGWHADGHPIATSDGWFTATHYDLEDRAD